MSLQRRLKDRSDLPCPWSYEMKSLCEMASYSKAILMITSRRACGRCRRLRCTLFHQGNPRPGLVNLDCLRWRRRSETLWLRQQESDLAAFHCDMRRIQV